MLSLAGSALGFLLPDFRRRAPFLPGASLTAKCLYAGNAALVVALVGFTHLQLAMGRADVPAYAGFLTFFAIIQIPAIAGLAWWAVHRLDRIEL